MSQEVKQPEGSDIGIYLDIDIPTVLENLEKNGDMISVDDAITRGFPEDQSGLLFYDPQGNDFLLNVFNIMHLRENLYKSRKNLGYTKAILVQNNEKKVILWLGKLK
ncbi:MAG: hypothetical protein UW24_C0029G0006 [Parcubacteria group bacterium GW2011_GWA2_44_12]|nr:MAG: hypothetical protein UW24_C0029G0006 [Parcubacteria group bacterium GW2011_GWA2_44_12]